MIYHTNQIIDLQLMEKSIMEEFHWTLEEIENQNYYSLLEVFGAHEDKKMASTDDLKKMFGLS